MEFGIGPDRPESSRSPWASMHNIEAVDISPLSESISASISIPGSKSVTNRALLIAGFASSSSTVHDILRSDDSWWCIDALTRLGANIKIGEEAVEIIPVPTKSGNRALYLGSAGTLARFLPGLLLSRSGTHLIAASDQLQGRPVSDLFNALMALGGKIEAEEGCYPALVTGGGVEGGSVEMSGSISSQFISGVLMAGPLMKKGLALNITDHIVQSDYVRITLDVMRDFGVDIQENDHFDSFKVAAQNYAGCDYHVEADASTASYFFALAAASGGEIRVENIKRDTLQPDIGLLDVLVKMGATVVEKNGISVKGPPQLKGGLEVDMRPMSDATLTLAAIAPFADAPISLRNVAHIRHHESDRIGVMVAALKKCGIEVEEFDDGMKIYPGVPNKQAFETHDDHRVAMSLSILSALSSGGRILDPGCVSKTCPQFFELINKLGVSASWGDNL